MANYTLTDLLLFSAGAILVNFVVYIYIPGACSTSVYRGPSDEAWFWIQFPGNPVGDLPFASDLPLENHAQPCPSLRLKL